ncbi:MAG: radical SAM family heme chaperone HemW [Chloroflexi bacterium]|nr:radical SAM family heme chaperone HemW [Chloroflexota bacterium]MBI3733688.1 radical SAM family heme chaperone HemW [Chloroflexota bacterium]
MSTEKRLSLYLHIPFCSTRCGYCHFNTYEGLERLFEPFTAALRAEVANTAQRLAGGWTLGTIFLGGGTPTHLPLTHLASIMRSLREQFRGTDDIEITSESNPSHISEGYLAGLREAGVNRISFGAQAFDEGLLKMLDREHSAAQIGEAVRQARRAGFANLNLDLMYGLPAQTLAQWSNSLDAAIALAPEHLSLYALTIDEGTAFIKRVQKGLLPEPDPDLAADMYLLAVERLAGAGFHQYEISNWARPAPSTGSGLALLASRHNLTYWLNEPYIGLGPGAHSYFAGRRFWNLLAPQVYIEKMRRGESVVADGETIGPSLEQAETVILGLRLNEGLARDRFYRRFGVPLDEVFGATLRQCAGWGLVADDGERVCLTTRGRLLSNEVFQRLLP